MINTFNFPDETKFSPDAYEQALMIEKVTPASHVESRRDLRNKTVVAFGDDSVSPVQCSFSISKNGNIYSLGVHVPDVAELVAPGTPLDSEAKKRGAVLFTDCGRRDLFPPNLVWDTFNLARAGEKLTLSVLLDIGVNGKLLDVTVDESVTDTAKLCVFGELDELRISSDSSAVMELRRKYQSVLPVIDDLYSLAATLRRVRHENGGMQSDAVIRSYKRADDSSIIGFERRITADSEQMIAEIVYFAAASVGQLMKTRRAPTVFVGQEPPVPEAVTRLAEAVGLDISSENGGARAVSDLSDLARGAEYYYLVCEEIKRLTPRRRFGTEPMYECVAASDAVVLFNRPVTRYSDLVSIRVMKSTLHIDAWSLTADSSAFAEAKYYAAVADKASEEYEKAVKMLENRSFELLLHDGDVCDGYYIDLSERGSVALLDVGARVKVTRAFDPGYGRKRKFVIKRADGRLCAEEL